MTRRTLHRTLNRVYFALGMVLAIALIAKFGEHLGLPRGSIADQFLKDLYEFIRDMALLIATCGVAYITNAFQGRSGFVAGLNDRWKEITTAKSELLKFTQMEKPHHEAYLHAYTTLSEVIDNMRLAFRNVGETGGLIGLYPFAPLHDMRRALQTLDPLTNPSPSQDQRKLVRDAILQSFYALRETFLEELDLEEPANPMLIYGARRTKKPGSSRRARRAQLHQHAYQEKFAPGDASINEMLKRLHDEEQSTATRWREASARTAIDKVEAKPAEEDIKS